MGQMGLMGEMASITWMLHGNLIPNFHPAITLTLMEVNDKVLFAVRGRKRLENRAKPDDPPAAIIQKT